MVHWFVDIEFFFLSQLENRDRTPAVEAFLLDSVEGHLDMTNQRLSKLQEMFNTYGPDIKVIA